MADLPEDSQWTPGIYQLETSDPVLGGPEGIDNLQAKQLAARTKWLKEQVTGKQPLDATLTALASLLVAGDKLIYATGVDQFATTGLSAFIRTLLDDVDATTALATLGAAPLASPLFTGSPSAPTAQPGANSLQLANTAFVQAALAALVASSPAALDTLNELAAAIGNDPNFATTMLNQLALKAPLASPALSGVPTAPTAATGTRNQQLATTAFVINAIAQTHVVSSISVNTALTAAHQGLVLIDAAGGARTITLPAVDAGVGSMEFVLRRIDSSVNVLTIATANADKIMLDVTAVAAGLPNTELLFAGDYVRLRSDDAGKKWWCVGQAQLPPSIESGLIPYSAPGVYPFTVPPVLRAGRRIPKITLTGGGGSGARSSTASGAGGSAGGTAIKRLSLAGLSSITLTIAEGGISRSTSNGSGYDGGTTSFGDIFSATGGGGGLANGVGGPPGSGVGGDINIDGGRSGNLLAGFTPLNRAGGDGGASYWGGGSVSADSANPAVAPGSGGGGAVSSSGKGADGIGKIEW